MGSLRGRDKRSRNGLNLRRYTYDLISMISVSRVRGNVQGGAGSPRCSGGDLLVMLKRSANVAVVEVEYAMQYLLFE